MLQPNNRTLQHNRTEDQPLFGDRVRALRLQEERLLDPLERTMQVAGGLLGFGPTTGGGIVSEPRQLASH